MSNFNNIFNFHSIEKLRELLQEDSDKKFGERKYKNKNNVIANSVENKSNNLEQVNQTNENLINI